MLDNELRRHVLDVTFTKAGQRLKPHRASLAEEALVQLCMPPSTTNSWPLQ